MKVSQEIKDKIRDLHSKGMSNSKISKEINLTLSIVRRIRDELNLGSIRKIRMSNLLNELEKLRNSNLSDSELGIIFNINHRTIAYHRRKINMSASMPELTYKNESDRIKGYMVRNSKFTAKRRNIEFNLVFEDFELPKYCPILGIKLTFRSESGGNHASHATLDRIDNAKGYIKGNVIVISRLANAMKNSANFDELLLFSKNISKLVKYYQINKNVFNINNIFPNVALL